MVVVSKKREMKMTNGKEKNDRFEGQRLELGYYNYGIKPDGLLSINELHIHKSTLHHHLLYVGEISNDVNFQFYPSQLKTINI